MAHPKGPVAVVGPTGVGKTEVAEQLAVRWNGEVVSADSMQVYRGMDVGTAKLPPADRRVPLHCVDLVDPGESYSAARFQHDARIAVEDILSRGLRPVIAGGTGLYVRAALDEFEFPAGQAGDDVRSELERRAAQDGPEALHSELASLDPSAAGRIHPNNVRRTIRALEMLTAGRKYSTQAEGFGRREAHYPGTSFIGLTMDRDALYARIDRRVDAMMERGLLAEVARLDEAGYRDALTAMQAIGYKELLPVLDGVAELADACESIKRASRRYAKRQLTWFRADPRVRWLDVTELSVDEAGDAAAELVESAPHRQ